MRCRGGATYDGGGYSLLGASSDGFVASVQTKYISPTNSAYNPLLLTWYLFLIILS